MRHSGPGAPSFLVLFCLEGLTRDIALEEKWWAQVWKVVLQGSPGRQRSLYRYDEHKFAMLMDGSAQDVDVVLSSLDAAATLFETGPSNLVRMRLGAAPIPEGLQDPAMFLNIAEAGLSAPRRETPDEGQPAADDTLASAGLQSHGGVTLDQRRREVTSGRQTVRLSRQEAALLCALMKQPHRVFSAKPLPGRPGERLLGQAPTS
ncbi:hypothetical protein ACFSC4_25975 [Deinococcus malanensis]|uniref:hypothetical protein n=1 Tax=Deinococcus malanensis TaxID=1706855 RepID=UPI0036388D4F